MATEVGQTSSFFKYLDQKPSINRLKNPLVVPGELNGLKLMQKCVRMMLPTPFVPYVSFISATSEPQKHFNLSLISATS
jgi:hypothetical protein